MSTPASPSMPWRPGLDGPDWLSPRSRVLEFLARVEAADLPPDFEPHRQRQIERLRDLLLTATDKGGFSGPDQAV